MEPQTETCKTEGSPSGHGFDEKLRHYADQWISLDLDDGVKVNYGKFGDLLTAPGKPLFPLNSCLNISLSKSNKMRRCNSMNEKYVQDMPLLSKADAAFRQAAKKIIQRARQTGTPVVVWEQGHIKEVPCDQFEITAAQMELREPRP